MTKTILTSIIAAVLAAMVTVKVVVPEGSATVEKQEESVYDRIMRTGKIRCGYNVWPPYKDKDINTGEVIGIDIEISKQLGQVTDLDFEFVEVVIGQDVEDLNSGKIDAMCGTGAWQLSTIKHVDFSQPPYYAPVYIYGRADETRFNKLSDLNSSDVVFSAIDGDLSTDLKERLFPKAKMSALSQMSQPSQLLMDVSLSKADITILDSKAAEAFDENNPEKIKQIFKTPLAVYGVGFSVKKGEKDMLNLINSAVNIMKDVGVINPILRKYDPGSVFLLEAQDNYKY